MDLRFFFWYLATTAGPWQPPAPHQKNPSRMHNSITTTTTIATTALHAPPHDGNPPAPPPSSPPPYMHQCMTRMSGDDNYFVQADGTRRCSLHQLPLFRKQLPLIGTDSILDQPELHGRNPPPLPLLPLPSTNMPVYPRMTVHLMTTSIPPRQMGGTLRLRSSSLHFRKQSPFKMATPYKLKTSTLHKSNLSNMGITDDDIYLQH